MGSFSGGSKSSKSNNSAIVNALKPASFYSPYGNYSNSTYSPNESIQQQQARSGSDQSLANYIAAGSNPYSIEDAYSGPVYDMILGNSNRQTDRSRERDFKELNNQLAARNQLGGSYDALMRSELSRNYSDAYQNNETNAFRESLGAIADTYVNNANIASQLSGINAQQYNRYYTPMAIANQTQMAQAPLQTALASHYSNQGLANSSYSTPWGETAINAGLRMLIGLRPSGGA